MRQSEPLKLSELALLVLAAHRGTQAWLEDSITEGLRLKFLNWCLEGGRTRNRMTDLAECPMCAGWHLSLLTYCAYALARRRKASLLEHVVAAWAVAGGQAMLATMKGAASTPEE